MNVSEILQKVPLFAGLDKQALEHITPLFEAEDHVGETRIITEGEPGDAMFIIVAGRVKITKTTQEGEEISIAKMKEGSYFGELSLVDNLPRSANVTTDGKARLLRLRRSAFDQMLNENKDFAISFYKNFLGETIARMRETSSSLGVSQKVLHQKTSRLDMIDADLSDAKVVQDYFLSTAQLQDESILAQGIKQSYIYRPFFEVGGDFLNVAKLNGGKYCVIIADVMGHGISAAMATGVLRSAFALFSKKYGEKPAKLMNRMNRHIYEIFPSLFATAYYAVIDKQENMVRMAKAGHMHPLIWKAAKNDLEKIDPPGPGLGILPEVEFKEVAMGFGPGDKFLFFTDGIIEQKSEGGCMYSHERLEQKFREFACCGEDHIVQKIFSDLETFKGTAGFQDDVTLLLLEF